MTELSVVGVTPYLYPRVSNSLFPERQSLTDWGIWSPKALIKLTRLKRSETDPLAAFSRISPIKITILWAVTSSMQETIVVGSGSLFYSKSPLSDAWRISLSEALGTTFFELLKILCP